MTNPHKGEVSFEANDQRYTMQFDVEAICALEAEAGKGIVALSKELEDPDRVSLTLVRKVVWACLQAHHPELSIKEAGELIPAMGGLLKAMELANKASSLSFPEQKESNSRPRKAGSPKNGIGPHSTVRGARSGATTNPSGEKPPAKSA